MARDLAIGVDLGATHTRVCLGDRSGRILKRSNVRLAARRSPGKFLEPLFNMIREITKGTSSNSIGSIAFATIGPLDLKRGGIDRPPNLPYDFVPIVEPIESEFDMPTYLVNDANAAALAETRHGLGKTVRDLVYITISTGIGGGAISGGRLLIGRGGNATEIGHMTVDTEERLACGCGGKGHWEAYCSGRHIPDFARLIMKAAPESRTNRGRKPKPVPDTPHLFKAAASGDPAAKRVIEEVGKLNSIAFANVANVFDPTIITVGGGVALNNQRAILGPIRRRLPDLVVTKPPKVQISPLGDDAGLLGALMVAFNPELAGQ